MGITRKEPSKSFIFCSMAALLCLRHVLQLFRISGVAAMMFKVLYVLFFAFSLQTVLFEVGRPKKVSELLFLIIAACCEIWLFLQLYFEFPEQLEKFIPFLLTFPLLICGGTKRLLPHDSEFFFKCLIFVGISLIVSIALPGNYRSGILTLYTSNGNQSGLLYMSVFFGIYTYVFLKKKNILYMVLLLGLLVGCFLTQSRTSFFACIICVALSFLFYKKESWKKRGLSIASILFLVLPLFYTTLIEILGKNFMIMDSTIATGREAIWPAAIEDIINNPFAFRVERVLAEHYGVSLGAHNVWLDVAWTFGLPVAVVFIVSLFKFVIKLGKRLLTKKRDAVIAACFIAGLVHMSFESALIFGALDYTMYFMLAVFSGLGLEEQEES